MQSSLVLADLARVMFSLAAALVEHRQLQVLHLLCWLPMAAALAAVELMAQGMAVQQMVLHLTALDRAAAGLNRAVTTLAWLVMETAQAAMVANTAALVAAAVVAQATTTAEPGLQGLAELEIALGPLGALPQGLQQLPAQVVLVALGMEDLHLLLVLPTLVTLAQALVTTLDGMAPAAALALL